MKLKALSLVILFLPFNKSADFDFIESITQILSINSFLSLASLLQLTNNRIVENNIPNVVCLFIIMFSLFPFVYNMMKCRLKAIESINAMFGTDIKIDFGSVWFYKNAELVDDVIDPNKTPTPEPDVDPTPTPDVDPEPTKDKDELLAMLEDESLSDEDKQAVKELLAELEGEE